MEVIGSQISLNVEGSGVATMGGKVDGTVTKEEHPTKKKKSMSSNLKSKGTFKKKTKNDAMEVDIKFHLYLSLFPLHFG